MLTKIHYKYMTAQRGLFKSFWAASFQLINQLIVKEMFNVFYRLGNLAVSH